MYVYVFNIEKRQGIAQSKRFGDYKLEKQQLHTQKTANRKTFYGLFTTSVFNLVICFTQLLITNDLHTAMII